MDHTLTSQLIGLLSRHVPHDELESTAQEIVDIFERHVAQALAETCAENPELVRRPSDASN